jgi:hypothetical protein
VPELSTPIGILSLEGTMITGRGSLYDTQVIPEPRARIEVAGATTLNVVQRPGTLIPAYRQAANSLVSQGAELLISNCGLSMTHQAAVVEASAKPTIMSSLLLLPLLWRVFGGGVGLLTYDAGALSSEKLRDQCGWSPDIQPVIGEVRGFDSWISLERDASGPLPDARMESDLGDLVSDVVSRGGDRVILVECTAMLPYLATIGRRSRAPVFDVTALTSFIRKGLDDAAEH